MNRSLCVRGTMVEDGRIRDLVIVDGVVARGGSRPGMPGRRPVLGNLGGTRSWPARRRNRRFDRRTALPRRRRHAQPSGPWRAPLVACLGVDRRGPSWLPPGRSAPHGLAGGSPRDRTRLRDASADRRTAPGLREIRSSPTAISRGHKKMTAAPRVFDHQLTLVQPSAARSGRARHRRGTAIPGLESISRAHRLARGVAPHAG